MGEGLEKLGQAMAESMRISMEWSFIEKCQEIAGNSDSYQEYYEIASLNNEMVPHLDADQINERIFWIWDEFWGARS